MNFGNDSLIAFQQDNQSRDDVPSKEEEEKRPSSSKSSIKQKNNSVISSGGNKDDVTNSMLARMLHGESFILQGTTKDHSSPPSPWIISATNSRPKKRRAFRYQTDDDSPDRLPISSRYSLGSIDSLTEDIGQSITARHPVYNTNHRSSYGDGNNEGWTPGEFPNPRENPRLCGLSSFLDQNHPQPKESSQSALNKTVLSSSSSLYPLLCDPDDMLGNTKREKIACAIDKFTTTDCSRELARTTSCASTSSGFGGGDNDEDGIPVPTSDDVTVTASSGDGVVMDDFSISSDKIDVKRGKGTPGKPSISPSTDTKEVGGGGAGEDFTLSPPIQVAVAVVKKINVQEIVAYNSFLNFQDQEDMINDAAQYFARYIHETWQVGSASSPSCPGQPHPHSGVLIFLSIQDRVCFISTSGSLLESVLPWWRLEQIMMDIQNELRHRDYGAGILRAIADIHDYLRLGPPTATDRIWDIISRFGVVIGFSLLTFGFAVWGEYKDRCRRWQYTEKQSKLNKKEFIVAKSLQVEYECYTCPICLEDFSYPEEKKPEKKESLQKNKKKFMKKTYGSLIDNYEDAMQHSNTTTTRPPSIGSDGLPLKLLRCGHAFDQTCWKLWVNKGTGDPCKCPVCRCDIGPKNYNCGRAPPTAPTPPAAITNNATIDNNNSNGDVVSGNNTVPVPHPGYDTVHQTTNARRMPIRRRERSLRFLEFNLSNIRREVLPAPISPPHATDEETHGLLIHYHQPLETIVFSTSGRDGDNEENRIDDANGLTIDDRTNEYDVQSFSRDDSHSESNSSLGSFYVERLGHTDV
eukprot:CAMPEP_0195537766 /NCGR_PEP_ID=MMETSP0794_2-20130614/48605_1 /TAXON_ID=515487 /ORGANISM="Stephanopyxis turris, Strain CCMP 815" /LENGTH=804 /DNA_ID=CAMNT_0040671585 /DNA_START=207 /DNA_END=2621 /DNA_ORIENTATION=+